MEINRTLLRPNYELRMQARERLRGNWGIAILLCLMYSIVCGLPSMIPYIGWIFGILIAGPMLLGLAICFVGFVRQNELRFESLFDGFKNFSSALVLQLLIILFTFLWMLLFLIPGIIAALSYSMAVYVLSDNPNMSAKDALEESKRLMKGNKGKLFLLQLSFIGWAFLCLFTFGIGYLWLIPYMQTSVACFYQDLRDADNHMNGDFRDPFAEL